MLICTGSQGEPMAALSRMANRDHPIRIGEGDTVLLASSLIPGNENAVYRVINGLTRWGATVVHKGNAMVHVSGHATAGELLYLLQRRAAAQRHAGARRVAAPARQRRPRRRDRRARATGSCSPRTASSSTSSTAARAIVGTVPCGYVYVDGSTVGDVTEASLKDRRILGDEGFISVVVVVDSVTGKIAGGPEIHARGFAEDDAVFDEVRPLIEEALAEAAARGRSATPTSSSSSSAGWSGRWVSDTYRRRPMIIPVVVEV